MENEPIRGKAVDEHTVRDSQGNTYNVNVDPEYVGKDVVIRDNVVSLRLDS